jgi:hypothetical protein
MAAACPAETGEIWNQVRITHLEIETSAHCNWRCQFCPVSLDPKPKASMDMALFDQILQKALDHRTVRWVTFNSYNEPTLDAGFEERVQRLAQTPFRLRLHTNGSMLDARKIDLLARTQVLLFVLFNVPAVTPDAFRAVTGSATFARTLANLDAAIAAGLPVGLSIQGTRAELEQAVPQFVEKYHAILGSPWSRIGGTSDRAGLLTNRYARGVHLDGPLIGCDITQSWLHIGVHGDCFLCCEDYYQRYVFANIRDGSIAEVTNTPRARELRQQIYGVAEAPADFICRSCLVMQWAFAARTADEGDRSASLPEKPEQA